MRKFKKINNIVGWIIFIIASFVYLRTIEPTASFWDCGEFISCANKLEVSHPPGYPMFAMLGRFAALFAGGDVTKIPVMVNSFSAICSGFTILFLFWTITQFARRIIGRKENYSNTEIVSIVGGGVVGALTLAFCDSFWFSAVEAVVFSPSSMFTAIIFWSILKWEEVAGEKYANHWIVLIAFLMGLSIGIHLLNLLTIPALALIVYFKRYKASVKGTIIALIISFFILGFVMYGIVQGTFVVASWFELFFVNQLSLPYNSGLIFFVVFLFLFLVWAIWYTTIKRKVLLNTIALCLTVMYIGYSSYTMSILRANANTPLNENDPSNTFNLLSYLGREQYGSSPLLYGPYYNAPLNSSSPDRGIKKGRSVYAKKDGKYVVIYNMPVYDYDPQFCTFFPRMWSPESAHVEKYKEWANITGIPIQTTGQQGEPVTINKPTFGENLLFFFRYQVNWMYIRYFMWNFSGRQNDIQGHGDILRGNWISGIKFLDEMRLGSQDNLPDNISGNNFKNNKARNKYYMLPFILGIIGFIFHSQKDKRKFWVVALFFFMTSIAIILFLNQKPIEPRERDYSYDGSYFAFAIWVGLGAMALMTWIAKNKQSILKQFLVIAVCLVLVPVNMAHENWNDHDRSNRYTSTDFAYDYLNSCDRDAILFTNGDNDTFPLWCAQEVLGVRTDVRVVNLSYLSADWYIDQMRRKVYESDPLPISMKKEAYQTGSRDVIYLFDRIKDYIPLKDAMDFVASDDPSTKTMSNIAESLDYIPTKKFSLPVDISKVISNGTVTSSFAKFIVPELKWDLGKRNDIYKADMMILDIVAFNNWERPICFVAPASDETYLGMTKYFRLDGFAYRLVPVENKNINGETGSIDSKLLYDKLMNKFKWGNVEDLNVNIDENNLRMIITYRSTFGRLAKELINENKIDSAIKVLDRSFKVFPIQQVPLNLWSISLIEQYYRVNQVSKANGLAQNLFDNLSKQMAYYTSLRKNLVQSLNDDMRFSMYSLEELSKLAHTYGQKDLQINIDNTLQRYMPYFEQ